MAYRSENVLRDLCTPEVDAKLVYFLQQFQQCYALLVATVDAYSVNCTRLYMLTPPEVLQLVGQARSLHAIRPLICKCFSDVADLQFADGRRIDGLTAPSGETVTFAQSIVATGPTHLWLPQLFTEMNEFVRFDILASHERLEKLWQEVFAKVLKAGSVSGAHSRISRASVNFRTSRVSAFSRKASTASSVAHSTGGGGGGNHTHGRPSFVSSGFGPSFSSSPSSTSLASSLAAVSLPSGLQDYLQSQLLDWLGCHTGQALCAGIQMLWYSHVKAALGGARTSRKKQVQQYCKAWQALLALLPELRDSLWQHNDSDYGLAMAKWEAVSVCVQAAAEQWRLLVDQKIHRLDHVTLQLLLRMDVDEEDAVLIEQASVVLPHSYEYYTQHGPFVLTTTSDRDLLGIMLALTSGYGINIHLPGRDAAWNSPAATMQMALTKLSGRWVDEEGQAEGVCSSSEREGVCGVVDRRGGAGGREDGLRMPFGFLSLESHLNV